MLLISPSAYDRIKAEVCPSTNYSPLENKMMEIMENYELNDIEKWYQFRHELAKYTNQKKQLDRKPATAINRLRDTGMQTKRIPKRDQEIQINFTSQTEPNHKTSQTNENTLETFHENFDTVHEEEQDSTSLINSQPVVSAMSVAKIMKSGKEDKKQYKVTQELDGSVVTEFFSDAESEKEEEDIVKKTQKKSTKRIRTVEFGTPPPAKNTRSQPTENLIWAPWTS
jgi:hypothetical protein